MTDKKYIQNQRDAIKRECKAILQGHFKVSRIILIVITILILFPFSYAHPDNWKETTITLEDYKVVNAGKGGIRLDMYDANGNCYSINRHEYNIKEQLLVGRQYTFTYSDDLLYNTVQAIRIGEITYLDRNDSIEYYWGIWGIFGVLVGIFVVILIIINTFVYIGDTKTRLKKISKYQNRIYDREHETD